LHVNWVLELSRAEPAWPDQDRLNYDEFYRPIVVRGRVILASASDDSVAAYDLATGNLRWRFFTGGPVRLAPASDGARIFAGSDDGWLYALGADQGNLVWKFKAAPKARLLLGNRRLIDTWCVRGGPVVADGRVYFAAGIWPFMGVFIHCLDAQTGKPLWSNSGEGSVFTIQPHGAGSFGGIAPQGTLTVSGPHLLVPGGRTLPACFDRATGKREHFVLATQTGHHEVAADDKHYYCAGAAYDAATGKPAGATLDSPVLAAGKLYGFAGNTIAAIETGELRPGPFARSPKVATFAPFVEGETLIRAGGRLYAGGKGMVAAFDLPPGNGKPPAWHLEVEGTVGSLAAAYDHLVVSTDEGRIYCLGPKPGPAMEHPLPTPPALAPAVIQQAETVLKDSGATAGYAVVLGAENSEFARALAFRSELHVVVLEPDAGKAHDMRTALHNAGLYGERVAVWAGDLASTPLPPYFAGLVVAEHTGVLPADPAACSRLFTVLHPYQGKAYLKPNGQQREALARFAASSTQGKATLRDAHGWLCLARSGGLPGAGNWTHEHADAANTRVSADRLVRAPLGLLWYGGSSHDGILPRHGHGPQPQVLAGRLVIEKVEGLRCVDIYTGRILWEAEIPGLGSYFNNTAHQHGAMATGTNYISTPGALYVRYWRECLRLDPATGKTMPGFKLPGTGGNQAGGADVIWGYLNVAGDYLIGGTATPEKLPALRPWMRIGKAAAPPVKEVPQAMESRDLFVMDRRTGKVLWQAAARHHFRHNAVCAGGGKLFAIDRSATGDDARLVVFDLATGKVFWSKDHEVFGTWLSYSAKHDVLIESGYCGQDNLRDEARGMRAFHGTDGHELWHDARVAGPPLIHGDWVLRSHGACGILDGKPLQVPDLVTDLPRTWSWTRGYGCNIPAASENLLTFRSGAAGFYDLARFGGTGNWGGFRSSCTNNLVVAGGVLTAPDYTRTCTCSYQNQTSLGLCPESDAEMWTYQPAAGPSSAAPVRRLGINFGAPGSRVDDRDTLWLHYSATSSAPAVPAQVQVQGAGLVQYYCHHASTVTGALPWVCASGATGVQTVRVGLGGLSAQSPPYTVRLYFAEPEELHAGDRCFAVSLQGQEVLGNLDVVKEAGGAHRGIVREFHGVRAEKELVVSLTPRSGRPTLLCGMEITAEGQSSGPVAMQGADHPAPAGGGQ
jgi:outer membrane protein assembly factor BamB